jgi:hypothetical protein
MIGEGALADLADAARRADGVDDESFGHPSGFLAQQAHYERWDGLSGARR